MASWLGGVRGGMVALCVLTAASARAATDKPVAATKSDGASEKVGAAPAKGEVAAPKVGSAAAAAKAEDASAKAEAAPARVKATSPKARESRRKVNAADALPGIGEGSSPASPPPLTMSGLRDEIRREATPVTIDPNASARTKVEQMLAEITRARAGLHDETTRLEAMMAETAESASTVAGGAAGPATAGPGGKPAKSPLDVVAKALRAIKPEAAAPIVARLDRRLAATVLLRMPPVDAGKIMGALKPDTAAELATQIAMRAPASEVKR